MRHSTRLLQCYVRTGRVNSQSMRRNCENPHISSLLNVLEMRPGFSPLSLFLIHSAALTPHIPEKINELIGRYPGIQLVSVAVDTNLGDYVSEVWSDELIQIKDFKKEDATNGRRWSIPEKKLNVQFNGGITASLTTSEAAVMHVGQEGTPTMYFRDVKHRFSGEVVNGESLTLLSINIPLSISSQPVKHFSNLIPLNSQKRSYLTITKAQNNLLLGLNRNHLSPPKVLMALLESNHVTSEKVHVFAQITNTETESISTYEVLAGGGEWGTGSDILVLKGLDLGDFDDVDSPYQVEFQLADQRNSQIFFPSNDGVWFESSVLDPPIDNDLKAKNAMWPIQDLLILGSTKGVNVDDKHYNSPHEMIMYPILNI